MQLIKTLKKTTLAVSYSIQKLKYLRSLGRPLQFKQQIYTATLIFYCNWYMFLACLARYQ